MVSALRVRGRNPAVEAWAASIPIGDHFITAPTVAEIERGVIAKERVLPAFADRVLPFDLPAARILATFRVLEHAPLDDALIAAIAQAAEMTVVTRNIKHFELLGVHCHNP